MASLQSPFKLKEDHRGLYDAENNVYHGVLSFLNETDDDERPVMDTGLGLHRPGTETECSYYSGSLNSPPHLSSQSSRVSGSPKVLWLSEDISPISPHTPDQTAPSETGKFYLQSRSPLSKYLSLVEDQIWQPWPRPKTARDVASPANQDTEMPLDVKAMDDGGLLEIGEKREIEPPVVGYYLEDKGGKNYHCQCLVPATDQVCKSAFRRREHLLRHIRTRHVMEKPFACQSPGCMKSFSRKDNLHQHMRTHRHPSRQEIEENPHLFGGYHRSTSVEL